MALLVPFSKLMPSLARNSLSIFSVRQFRSTAALLLSAGEQDIYNKLKTGLDAGEVKVEDISGGCGASYEVFVVSDKFKGLSMLKQHQMVNQCLKEELKTIHALRIHTALSDD